MKEVLVVLPALACLTVLPLLDAEAGQARTAAIVGERDRRPPKDCTRINGRIGYYGNPWCTPAEIRAWEIWTSSRGIR